MQVAFQYVSTGVWSREFTVSPRIDLNAGRALGASKIRLRIRRH